MENEEWKSIPGFDKYEASNHGRIRSKRIFIIREHFTKTRNYIQPYGGNLLKSRIMTQNGKYPHAYVDIRKDNKSHRFLVHRLILLTFVGECPANMQCCHNDGNGLNNKLSNLRWDTATNNQLDRKKHGTDWAPIMKGSSHPRALITEEDVIDIRNTPKSPTRTQDLCKKYNLSKSSINTIIARKSWKHI